MRVKILRNGGRRPVVIDDATVMIVEDAKGDPVSVACEYGISGSDGSFCVAHVQDPYFNTVLHNLGIDRVVIPVNARTLMRREEDLPIIMGRDHESGNTRTAR